MAKRYQPKSKTNKIIRVVEYDDATAIWTYDYSFTKNGPVSIEIKYKNETSSKRKTKKRVT